MGPTPLRAVVTIDAHGILWHIAPPHRTADFPEPILSPDEIRALDRRLSRRSMRALSPEMARAIASVKRIFRDGDERALIEDCPE